MDANNERVAPQLDTIMKLQGHLSKERNSKLSFRVNKFELNKKREASKKEAEYLLKTEDATADLIEIVDNPDSTPFQKQKELAVYALTNPRLIKNNPMVSQMLAAGNLTTKADLDRLTRLDEASGFEMQAAQYGFLNPQFLKDRYTEGGKTPTAKQKANISLAEASWGKRKADDKVKDTQRKNAIVTLKLRSAENTNKQYGDLLDSIQKRMTAALEEDDDSGVDAAGEGPNASGLWKSLEVALPAGGTMTFTSYAEYQSKMTKARSDAYQNMLNAGHTGAGGYIEPD
tara:strand:- start:629 stop:1489 length:861 start_codon:yes stop_codon:yes gene_type:complete